MKKTTAQHMNRRAFTIPELLVSIFLLTLAMALVFPTLGAIKKLSGVTAGVNTVGAAAKAIRYYAGRDRSARFDDIEPGLNGIYSGSALVFQPDGTIRLTENVPSLRNGNNTAFLELLDPPYSGYGDITLRDPLKLPRDVSAVGITRGASLEIVAAPFAVRFDQHGRLIVRRDSTSSTIDDGWVHYDFNNDGRCNTSNAGKRDASTYNPDNWTASGSFEKLEAVTGVILYSRSQFKNDGGNWAGNSTTRGCGTNGNSACGSIADWMTTNGRPVLFSRYTGQAIRVQ